MKYRHLCTFVLFLFTAAFFHACSSTEDTVVVVEETPRTEQAAEPDTVDEQFTEVTLGLIDPVTNFDPLFADNLSTQRTLSLIYDGLYTLDVDGNPVPDIASSVEISDDSLEYVFTLNPNKYFHNSPVFTAGVGRQVNALDIKQVFERAARIGVPGNAAKLLEGISGFENYVLEQHTVYDPEKRVLEGVAGIQLIDNQSLGIVLDEKDPHFLHKLASPYLFIYPREAINGSNEGLSNNPVGSGPYQLNRTEENGQIILIRADRRSRNSGERQDLYIHRINLRYYTDESQLFQEFASDRIDWIPEIGPEISDQVVNGGENLQESYSDSYEVVTHDAERITTFYLNENTTANHEWLVSRLGYLTTEDFNTRGVLTLNVDDFEVNEDAEPGEEYFASYTDNVVAQRLLTELHNIIFVPESSLVMFDIHTPTRQTSIYTRQSNSMHEFLTPLDGDYWLRMDTTIIGLYKDHVTGIEPTSVPWLLNLERVGVRNTEISAE